MESSVRADVEQLAYGGMIGTFSHDSSAIRMPDDDRIVRTIEHLPQCLRVLDKTEALARPVGLATGRQSDGPACHSRSSEQLLGDQMPPPIAVADQRTVDEDDLHSPDGTEGAQRAHALLLSADTERVCLHDRFGSARWPFGCTMRGPPIDLGYPLFNSGLNRRI